MKHTFLLCERIGPILNGFQNSYKEVSKTPFELPRLVVVGAPGSGKSSVIETLCGRTFLPKDIRNRYSKAIEIHLQRTDPNSYVLDRFDNK